MNYISGSVKKAMTAFAKIHVAILLGCLIFLLGDSVRCEELSLKEYIYLDGRLLAIEHQTVQMVAEKPAADSIQKFFAYGKFDPLSPAAGLGGSYAAACFELLPRRAVSAAKAGYEETDYIAARQGADRGGIENEHPE